MPEISEEDFFKKRPTKSVESYDIESGEQVNKTPTISFDDFWEVNYGSMTQEDKIEILKAIRVFDSYAHEENKCLIEIDGKIHLTEHGKSSIDMFFYDLYGRKKLAEELESLSGTIKKISQNIVVHSNGSKANIILDKIVASRSVIGEFTEKNGRNPESLVYFGSADDIETVLLTQIPLIYLVDPYLSDQNIQTMLDRIQTYAEVKEYDNASGKIEVQVDELLLTIFVVPKPMEDFTASESNPKFDIAFLFNKGPSMSTADAEKSLTPDGIVFDNRKD